MARAQYILAIDQGTTGSRAILYSAAGVERFRAYQEFPQYFPQPGWVEHDADEIWQSVLSVIQTVLKNIGPDELAGIGITNQRETTVIWDRATGRPLHRAIVWQCRRTAKRCHELSQQKGFPTLIREKTGLSLDPYFSASKLEWLLQNVPKVPPLLREHRLAFGTTDAWVLWNLTGGAVHATDFTNASRTMLFNIENKTWDPMLLKKFSVPDSCLPKVLPSAGIFGQTVKLGRLPAGIPIAGMAGDQQAALFGQTCFAPGTAKNTYGTGSFILQNTGSHRIHSQHGLITTLACGPAGEPAYALEGSIFIAGAAIQWLRDGLQLLKRAGDSEKMALSLPSNEGVYFVPALTGLGAPYWDPEARGTLVGLTRGTRREHLVRAGLEAMAYATRDVLSVMNQEAVLSLPELKADGGAIANNFLCQFQADLLGIPVLRPKSLESTALGAAFLAGLTVGFWKTSAELKALWKLDKKFQPRASAQQAAVWYQGWQQAVQRTLTRSS